MKEKLLYCVLFLVTYKCAGHSHTPILGGILSGAQTIGTQVKDVLEGIALGGLNFQGHLQVNAQQGGYQKPVPNNYGNYAPNKQPEVETIVVVVEEGSQQEQGHQGQYGQGYGPRPHNHYNEPSYPNRPGYGGHGGGNNNGPWNHGHQHRPHHHHYPRPGYGFNPQGPGNNGYNGNGNYNGNGYYNNENNIPMNPPNRPFDIPMNNEGSGHIPINPPPNMPFDKPVNQNPSEIPTAPPHRPFDNPENNFGNIPTNPPNRPFDRPVNENNNAIPNQGIPNQPPSQTPFQGQLDDQNKPADNTQPENKPQTDGAYKPNVENNSDKKPVFTTENSLNNIDKTSKKPEDDDLPLFVPLNPQQYIYGGDKIEINAPKRETNQAKPEDDYSDSNIDPLDIRFGEKP